MNNPLRQFIADRRVAIKTQMTALREELRQLDAAEQAIAGAGDGRQTAPRGNRATIMDMVLDVLLDHPAGAKSDEIIAAVRAKHGIDVPRSSMSPQLSRLKSQGKLTMDDSNTWRLAKNEAPAGDQPAGASEFTDEADTSSNESPSLNDLLG